MKHLVFNTYNFKNLRIDYKKMAYKVGIIQLIIQARCQTLFSCIVVSFFHHPFSKNIQFNCIAHMDRSGLVPSLLTTTHEWLGFLTDSYVIAGCMIYNTTRIICN